jgi:pteridine reductase
MRGCGLLPSNIQDHDPENSLAVVTGAGRRLGRELALGLGRLGYTVGIHYHSSENGALELQAELHQINIRSLLLPGDLTQPSDIQRIFRDIDVCGVPLRVWVNSAAVMLTATLDQMSVDEWDATFNLNLRAAWLCSREAARRMDASGVIINVSDTGARKLWTQYAAYGMSKSGLEMLTRLLAKTYAPVRVNAVAPGLILPPEELSPEEWQRLVTRLPLRQAGTPDQVWAAVEFFIQNEYISGQVLIVDGGYDLI